MAAVAFVARLVPVLTGGGLYGIGNYDDGVYFSAAIGLVHGRLPYRDFLLLHPPGALVALSPFAALSRVTGEATAWAVARVAWMVLGAINAVLVVRILRPIGLFAAVLGGLGYALFHPAIYVEQTTTLEGLGNTCLLVAMLLLTRTRPARPRSSCVLLMAGGMLGLATSVKIWGVVAVVLVFGWLLFTERFPRALLLVAGAAAGAALVCGPFFLVDPSAMWRDVVTAQLGRSPTSAAPTTRLDAITGLHLFTNAKSVTVLLLVALAVFATMIVLAWSDRRGRLAAILLMGLGAFLLVSPPWFLHYAALTAPPAAIVFGAAVGRIVRWSAPKGRRTSLVVGSVLTVLLVGYAAPLARDRFGERFPRAALGHIVASEPGCVATDSPATLIELNVMGRNISRSCRLVVDLSGYTYVIKRSPGRKVARAQDPVWQKVALTYLRDATLVIIARFKAGVGFSAATAGVIHGWPAVGRAHGFVLRRPTP